MKSNYPKAIRLLILCVCTTFSFQLNAQISGTVFRDFNSNGVKNNTATFNEPFVSGISIRAFNAANMQLGTTKTTNASGAYSFSTAEIPSGTVVRIEFSGLGIADYSSNNGTGNGTNVQFATAPNAAVSYAVNAPDDYWNNTASPNPTFLVITEQKGLSAGGYLATAPTVIQTNTLLTGPYNPASSTTTATGTMTTVATQSQTGSLFGLAIQKKQQRYFAAAYLRRAVEIGPRGPGGIYLMDKVGANFSLTSSFSLQGVTPSNGGGALDFGTVTRVTTPASNNNYIANNGNWPGETRDMDAYAKAGTMSYGDIESDPNSDNVYMINLFQRKLIVFNGSAASATLNGASAATLAPYTTAYDITTLPGMPAVTGTGNNIRPYAVKIYKGYGYLGVVSDAMATQSDGDLRGYILQFDPNNIAAGFTTVVTINFNTWPTAATRYWKPWATTWAQAGGTSASGPRDYPTPIIAGIEFNEDGSMDIGIKDRWGDQGGVFEFSPVSGGTGHTQTSINGDLLHACWTGTIWALEGTAGSCTKPAVNTNGSGATNSFGTGFSYGNTGTEWYADRSGDGGNENVIGGMTKLMGSGKILSTVYDPVGQNEDVSGSNYWSTQGIQYSDVTTGVKSQIARVLDGLTNSLDKSNGMGDIEFLAEYQPLQIGNRIWLDANGDGVQGADETTAGVPTGTTVTLRSPGIDGIYGNADDQTWTTTTDAAGNYYFSALSSADNRKPATWAGVGNVILPGYDYRVEVAVPSGSNVTKTNASSNSFDNIDNDATQTGTTAYVTFNTSNTNHNYDFGFKTLASLGNKVWLDNGVGGGTANDGYQNGTEPGVAGVAVNLYLNGTDGLPNTADDILVGTTLTDGYGMYYFDNLTPSTNAATSYNVRVTAPANYSFTTQTNTTDDNNTTGTSTTGSDVNAFGTSYSIFLSNGENNPNIDAGLIFHTVAATSSIGDYVWFDTNGNGNQDSGEPGVSGVTVTLYDAVTGNVLAITTTDANGKYLFTNLPNGTYQVGFSAPAGTVLSPNVGGTTAGNGTTNSDANPLTGKTTTITISAAGTVITGIDAGITNSTKGALGDYVWNDLNQNGIQESGEPGVPGVVMELYAPGADGVIGGGDDVLLATTTTDAKGYYIFTELDPGKYFVVATPVAGYSLSPKQAANPASYVKDSDFGAGAAPYATKYVSDVKSLYPTTGGITRDMTIDMGIYNNTANLNSLGDKVWNDVNNNGLQDGTEVGVANITVRLLNSTGVAVNNPATGKPYVVFTDENGNYKFVNLPDGNYIVEFDNLPSGYTFTQADASGTGAPGSGTDGANDSDPNTVTGRTGIVNLDAASAIPTSVNIITVDAGIKQGVAAGTASLGNRVWYDVNNNGLQDAGEYGVANVKCELLDASNNAVDGDPNTAGVQPYIIYTNGLGEYLFTGLPAGDYKVRFSNFPAGYTSSTANAGTDKTIDADANFVGTSVTATTTALTAATYTLQQGEDNLTVDMGIVPATGTNSLGNFVWYDANNDGLQTAGETGVQGVAVSLYTNGADGLPGTSDDVLVKVTTTDADGAYSFVGLADGNYNVGFSNLPAGYSFTNKDAAGFTAANGSDANTASGRTLTYGLDPTSATTTAVVNNDVDGGIVTTTAALGNYVWLDSNGDGVQDATEKGVSGVTVILYAADGTSVISSTITDANGRYYFSNLTPGSYVVGFSSIPGNLGFTQQNTPGDNGNNTNSDASPTTGKTGVIVLSAGEIDLTIDAGLRPDAFASVGDYVWLDVDGDGVQDVNEPGVSGIIVTLYDAANNVVGTAVTDGNGKYLISNVVPGNGYYVIFSNLPTSATFTTQNSDVSTGDVTLGSDANTTTGRTASFNLSSGQYLPNVDAGLRNIKLLPIKILSFSATPQGNSVQLQWQVGEQSDVLNYTVEFSTDGRNFNAIANKAVTSSANYDAMHNAPQQNGINYYRLKVTATDGSISYSEIRKVVFGSATDISVYPNPVSSVVKISIAGNLVNKSATISIISVEGKLMQQQKVKALAATETLKVHQLASGKYLLQLVSGNEVITKSIEIVR